MTSTSDSDAGLTRDAFLGGRVRIWQPKSGFRSGIDAVLLAAAVPARTGETVLELGCGTGAALACLAARVSGLVTTGVELQETYADLARRNGLPEIITADLADLPPGLRQRQFAHVMMNPPYFDRNASSHAHDVGRDIARGGATSLSGWIGTGARRLAPRGSLTLILRSERLAEAMRAIPTDIGSLVLLPIAPRTGRDAKLILLRGLKDGRAALRVLPPMILHDGPAHLVDGDDYSAAATAVLRDASGLELGN